jgi:phosphoribosyl-AMP cyclohydrolase
MVRLALGKIRNVLNGVLNNAGEIADGRGEGRFGRGFAKGEAFVVGAGFLLDRVGGGEKGSGDSDGIGAGGKKVGAGFGKVREGEMRDDVRENAVGVEFDGFVFARFAEDAVWSDQTGETRGGQPDFFHRTLTEAQIRRGGRVGGFGHGFVLSRRSGEVIQAARSFKTVEFDFKFTEEGLIPVIVQEANGGERPGGRVLMFAWMNRESLALTLERGLMTYWSRSRRKLWLKGESSGHTQRVVRWWVDCDRDVLLFEVEQETGACHTGYESCFFQEMDRTGNPLPVREEKMFDDGAVYTKKG